MARVQAITQGFKKIRYACRKTLADNRPRVKGRFAKVHGPDGVNAKIAAADASGEGSGASPPPMTMAAAAAAAADGGSSPTRKASPVKPAMKSARSDDADSKLSKEGAPSVWWQLNAEGEDGNSGEEEHIAYDDAAFHNDALKRCFSEPALMHLDKVGSGDAAIGFGFDDSQW